MMRKLARGTVRARYVILILMLALAVLSAMSIGRTKINYDLSKYLDESTMTSRALRVMQEEFGSSEQLRVMFENLDEQTLQARVDALNALEEVMLATHDATDGVREADGTRYQLVTLTLSPCDGSKLVETIREMFPGSCAVGGTPASQLDVQRSVAQQVPRAMLVAVAVVLAVLLLTSHAWLEPLVLLIVLATSILINMGTNFIFADISFITFAVCAILQLALSIDYAIMLLHSYNAYRDAGMPPQDAMTEALANSFMPIASSALTTVAGLMALLFMSFAIGFDIGLVLSKGILISMATVFLQMPAIVLMLEKPLRRTRHKPLQLGGRGLAKGVYTARKAVLPALLAVILVSAYLQTENTYSFTDAGRDQTSESAQVDRVFGASDPLALLVPSDGSDAAYDTQRALVNALLALRVDDAQTVREINAMVTTGEAALKYYTAEEVAALTGMNKLTVQLFFTTQGFGKSVRADKLLAAAGGLLPDNERLAALQSALDTAQRAFNSEKYSRLLLTLSFSANTEASRRAIDEILAQAGQFYGQDAYLTGTAMMVYDISNAFEGDLTKVNLITLLAIFLIVALSFRSLSMPVMLLCVIEGAIWVTMAISRVAGEPIFFMCYLICLAIQMGATIDYAILLANHYRAARQTQPPADAIQAAMDKALPTILTSGAILITAGFIIGRVCSVYYISAIGLLLSRGALISVLLILTLLPALLTVCDRLVMGKAPK